MRSGGTVIVIDDSAEDRELSEVGLRAAGITGPIHLISSGRDALDYLKGEGRYSDRTVFAYPSLIITDLKMPGVDGFAILEYLRDHPSLAVIPTIVFSSSSDANDVQMSYRLGASSYLVKPPTGAELVACLRDLVTFWKRCEAPITSEKGFQVETDPRGKLGERFSTSSPFPTDTGAPEEKPPKTSHVLCELSANDVREGTIDGQPALINFARKQFALLPENYRLHRRDRGIAGVTDSEIDTPINLTWREIPRGASITVRG